MTKRRISIPAFIVVMLLASMAWAGGRKRIVVLDLEGPKADKFHDDIVQIIKKSHIVVPTAKWNSTAEFLDAGVVNEKNFQKIAKKLKIDGIVQGKIEKRRDEYIIRLKLRAGTSGEVIGNGVDTKAEGPRIDGKSSKDIKDELLGQIDQLDGNHEAGGGAKDTSGDDDDDDKPAAKKTPVAKKEEPKKKTPAKASDDDDDDKPAAKKAPVAKKEEPKKKTPAKASDDDDDDKPAAKKAPVAKKEEPKKKTPAKASDDDDDDKPSAAKKVAIKKDDKSEDDDDSAKKKSEDDDDGAKKKVATAEDGEDTSVSTKVEPKGSTAEMLAPAKRGVDIVAGLSLMMRKFTFTSNLDAATKPPGYHQAAPVPAAYVDATLYPLGLGHGGGALANIGIGFTFDKVLGLQSQITNPDGMQVKEPTSEQRYSINLSYRFPFASGGMAAIVVGYGAQSFSITHGADATVDIPDIAYTGVAPQVLLRYPLGAKMYLDLDGGAMLLSKAGQIQDNDQYGQATVLGITADVGIDYMVTKNIFARVTGRFETVGLSFKGTGTKSTSRDNDPMTQDVTAARDNYFGGTLTVGYAY